MEARALAVPLALQPLRAECGHDEDYELALRTLHTYVARLLDHPSVPKYKAISQHNASFHRRLGRYESGCACLNVIGYQLYDTVWRFEGRDTRLLKEARLRLERELAGESTEDMVGGGPVARRGGVAAHPPTKLTSTRGRNAISTRGGLIAVGESWQERAEAAEQEVLELRQQLQQGGARLGSGAQLDDSQVANHPAFRRMQARYLDDVASLGEKIRVIDENYDRKDALVREQAATIAVLEEELGTSADREELVTMREELQSVRAENQRLLSHNQHLRGRLSLVQGDEFAEDDIEVADMTDWTRDQRSQYISKIIERLFARSKVDSVDFLEMAVSSIQRSQIDNGAAVTGAAVKLPSGIDTEGSSDEDSEDEGLDDPAAKAAARQTIFHEHLQGHPDASYHERSSGPSASRRRSERNAGLQADRHRLSHLVDNIFSKYDTEATGLLNRDAVASLLIDISGTGEISQTEVDFVMRCADLHEADGGIDRDEIKPASAFVSTCLPVSMPDVPSAQSYMRVCLCSFGVERSASSAGCGVEPFCQAK
jgi:regulator of replication initiation timing